MDKRVIEFRGKSVDNGEWVYGHLCFWAKAVENKLFEKYMPPLSDEYLFYEIIQTPILKFGKVVGLSWERVVKETVGQFTGLTDKNGTKIFEGDIVRNERGISTVVFGKIGYDSSQNGLTGFALEDWYSERIDAYELNYYFNFIEVEVIGNIHEKGGNFHETKRFIEGV